MRAGATTGVAALLALLAGVLPGAGAHDGERPPVMPYGGDNPFACELQQAGTGADFPDPAADPFCVEYDKRHQNVSEGGVVEFLALEPARVAAASPKCFYYQRDHWRGSIVQEDGRTQTYAWDGSYFFDKAHGLGGAYVESFSVNGQTGDPTQVPGFPEEWRPYFGEGRGGMQTTGSVRADPRCLDEVRQAPPHREPAGCIDRSGRVGRSVGGLSIGMSARQADARLGPPARVVSGMRRWCLMDGGKLIAGFRERRLAFAITTSARFRAAGVAVGDPARHARSALRGERVAARRGSTTVLADDRRSSDLLVGLRGGRVSFLALAAPRLPARSLARYLDRSR